MALLGLSALGYLHTRYLARHPALATPSFTPEVARMFERRAAVFAVVPLMSMLVAFFDTHLALYVYVLLAAAHLLPNPIHDRVARGERQLVRSRDEAAE